MKERCQNKNSLNFVRYGARGITVSEDWQFFENFRLDMWDSFVEHVRLHGIKDTTLERIDSKKGYCKENCKWETYLNQGRNRCDNVKFLGETATEASLRLGGTRKLVYMRMLRGWSKPNAFTIELRRKTV